MVKEINPGLKETRIVPVTLQSNRKLELTFWDQKLPNKSLLSKSVCATAQISSHHRKMEELHFPYIRIKLYHSF